MKYNALKNTQKPNTDDSLVSIIEDKIRYLTFVFDFSFQAVVKNYLLIFPI